MPLGRRQSPLSLFEPRCKFESKPDENKADPAFGSALSVLLVD